jgi:hypothetical protein
MAARGKLCYKSADWLRVACYAARDCPPSAEHPGDIPTSPSSQRLPTVISMLTPTVKSRWLTERAAATTNTPFQHLQAACRYFHSERLTMKWSIFPNLQIPKPTCCSNGNLIPAPNLEANCSPSRVVVLARSLTRHSQCSVGDEHNTAVPEELSLALPALMEGSLLTVQGAKAVHTEQAQEHTKCMFRGFLSWKITLSLFEKEVGSHLANPKYNTLQIIACSESRSWYSMHSWLCQNRVSRRSLRRKWKPVFKIEDLLWIFLWRAIKI